MPVAETQKKRSPKPVDTSWITPVLTVHDINKAIEFYEKAFGFEKKTVYPDKQGRIVHAEVKFQNEIVIMLGLEGAFDNQCKTPANSGIQCPINLYVYCPDIDGLYKRAKKAGAKITMEIADMFWGDRVAQFEDPDGYRWMFATNVADFDPSKQPF